MEDLEDFSIFNGKITLPYLCHFHIENSILCPLAAGAELVLPEVCSGSLAAPHSHGRQWFMPTCTLERQGCTQLSPLSSSGFTLAFDSN